MRRVQHFRIKELSASATGFIALLVGVFVLMVSAVGFWKYAHYRYQGLDLAIYTNVLYNLSHGNGWYSSIQGGSYLGDHVEPILLAIAPLFRLWPDARLLIILQALVLGLTAVPVYVLIQHVCERSKAVASFLNNESSIMNHGIESGSRSVPIIHDSYPIILSGLWLLNPLLWNAALFEFHALAFAPLFLLSAAVAYVRRRFGWFSLFLLLSLSVREDIALIVAMFGLVAAVDWWRERSLPSLSASQRGEGGRGRERCASMIASPPLTPPPHSMRRGRNPLGDCLYEWRWIVVPAALGIAWFLFVMRIAANNSASGAYKFLIYYGWLRDALGHPLTLLQHLASIGNIDMVLGLLLPFLFLPLLRPHWLLLAIPPLLQIFLAAPGGSNVVVETHYALLFLPALVLASIDALRTFSPPPDGRGSERGWGQSLWFRWLARRFPLPRPFAVGLGIASFLAVVWALGPFPGIARVAVRGASAEDQARRVAYDALIQIVQSRASDKSVAAGYAALPHVAARSSVYSLAYLSLGVTQYGLKPYVLPASSQYLVMDQRDALVYAVQFPSTGWSAPYAADGPTRLREIITEGRFAVVAERNGVALLERDAAGIPLSNQYIEAATPPNARLTVDELRDVTVSSR